MEEKKELKAIIKKLREENSFGYDLGEETALGYEKALNDMEKALETTKKLRR